MEIRQLELQTVTLAGGGHNAHQRWPTRAGLRLTLTDEEGRRASGEASPLPGYSPESIDDARSELQQLGSSIAIDEGDVITSVHAVSRLLASGSARCAVEQALLRLIALRRGTTVAALLGARPDAAVARSALLPPLTDDFAWVAAACTTAIQRGLTTMKAKVGAPGRWDEERHALQRLRDRFADAITLRLDFNRSLTRDELEPRLAQLVPLAPELVEEPGDGWLSMPDSPLLLAADESLVHRETEVREAIGRGTCRAVVLKPMVLGLLRSHRIAREARAAGAEVIVTHLFDGADGRAAAAALALADATLPCGLDDANGTLPARITIEESA